MSNMHRLRWIDAQIRQGSSPNCDRIAEHFCISRRQAARDVEYLKDSMGAPIQYCRRRRGYYYTHDTYVLGGILVTDQQRRGLAYLADQYAKLETEHARHLARLFRRLINQGAAEEPEIALPLFPIDPLELGMFDKINKAIEASCKMEITYMDEHGSIKEVRLSPYKLYSFQHENFVVGYCEPGKQIRFFSLSGLLSADVTDTKYDLSPLLKQAEIVPELIDEANFAYVRLAADPYANAFPYRFHRVADRLYRVEYYDPHRLLAVLFACPVGAAIESPKWLRNLYIAMLEKKLRFMQENEAECLNPSSGIECQQVVSSETISVG